MKLFKQADVTGGYYLENVRELVSEFRVDADGTFRFMLIYGALDRYGSGQWELNGDRLNFKSRPWPGTDFALIQTGKLQDNGIFIRITDSNKNIVRYVAGSLQRGRQGSWQGASNDGLMRFPSQELADIALISELCPERISLVSVPDPTDNYFQFRFEPWTLEYFFKDFSLQVKKDGLYGKHPMLQGDNYFYRKR
mgnify:FL=1